MSIYSADQVIETLTATLEKPIEQYADYQSSTILMDFAEQLINYRIDHHMNQTQLAHKLGISQPMVSQYESGSNNITIGRMCEICEKLGLIFRGSFNHVSQRDTNGL